MSNSLASAFNFLLSKKFITCRIDRKGTIAAIDIQLSPSNGSRARESTENMKQYSNEYVLSTKFLAGTAMDAPKRGDRLLFDNSARVEIIGEVERMYGMGDNALFGWRLRTE